MTDFKVGDKVRATGLMWSSYFERFGEVVELNEGRADEPRVMFEDDEESPWDAWGEYAVELVRAADVAQGEADEVPADAANAFPAKVRAILSEIGDTLIAKNQQYGNSALEPVRIFSKASAVEQIKVRMDDKISRLVRGNGEGDEDAQADLLGYIVLLKIAQSEDD